MEGAALAGPTGLCFEVKGFSQLELVGTTGLRENEQRIMDLL
jgi:hypothetical protein